MKPEIVELPYLCSGRCVLDHFLEQNGFMPVEFNEAEEFSKTKKNQHETVWAPGCKFPDGTNEVLITKSGHLCHFQGKTYWHAGTKLLVKRLPPFKCK